MDESSTNKQVRPTTNEPSIKAATARYSGRRDGRANSELLLVNRKLKKLQIELRACYRQIECNLKRREMLVELVTKFVSIYERHMIAYEQADSVRAKFKEALSDAPLDIYELDFQADENPKRQKIVEDLHDAHEKLAKATRRLGLMQKLCAAIEPLFALRTAENEKMHTDLCEKFKTLERSRQKVAARRKQLLRSSN